MPIVLSEFEALVDRPSHQWLTTLHKSTSRVDQSCASIQEGQDTAMSSRYAFQSPSITNEKGAYRMRVPRSTRPAFDKRDSSSVMTNANKHVHCESGPPTQDRKVALVVALLAIGSCLCFVTAYYLYATRCGTCSFALPPHVALVLFLLLPLFPGNVRVLIPTYLSQRSVRI